MPLYKLNELVERMPMSPMSNISPNYRGKYTSHSNKTDNHLTMPTDLTGAVQHYHPGKFNTAKLKQIQESKNLVEEFDAYLNVIFNEITPTYVEEIRKKYDPKSQENISSMFISYLGAMEQLAYAGIPQEKIQIMCTKAWCPDMLSEDGYRKILNLRIANNKFLSYALQKALNLNYQALGLSEAEAQTLMGKLGDDNTNAEGIQQVHDILKNPDILKNFKMGEHNYDFRSIGGGVMLLSGDDDIKFCTHPANNLTDIFKYDCIVSGHGDYTEGNYTYSKNDSLKKIQGIKIDKKTLSNKQKSIKNILQELKSHLDTVKSYIEKYDNEKINKYLNMIIKYINKLPDNIDDIEDASISEDLDSINRITNSIKRLNNGGSIFDSDEPEYTIDNSLRTDLEKINKTLSELKRFYNNDIYQDITNIEDGEYNKEAYKDRYKNAIKNGASINWTIQEITTPVGKRFRVVVDLLRQLKQEGFKNVLITACNPGSVSLPKDIRDDPDFKVTMGMSSVYKESTEIDDEYDDILQEMDLLENYLDSKSHHSRYTRYLDECTLDELYQEYDKVNKRMILNEGVGQALMNFAHRVVEIIIAIWKKIVGFFKSIINNIINFFTGKDNNNTETSKEFEVTVVKVDGNKLNTETKKFKKLSEAQKFVKDQCKAISSMIDKNSKEQVDGIKGVEIKLQQVQIKPAEEKDNKEEKTDEETEHESAMINEIVERMPMAPRGYSTNSKGKYRKTHSNKVDNHMSMSTDLIGAVQNYHPGQFNTAKMRQVQESKNLAQEFDNYIGGVFTNIAGDYKKVFDKEAETGVWDQKSQADISMMYRSYCAAASQLMMISGITDEKQITEICGKAWCPNMMSEDGYRKILNLRIANNKFLSAALRKALNLNYQALGLSETEAKMLLGKLKDENTEAEGIQQVHDMLKNPNLLQKFKMGEHNYDFRPIGGGILLLSPDDDIKFSHHPSNKLTDIFKYDCYVVGHGGYAKEDDEYYDNYRSTTHSKNKSKRIKTINDCINSLKKYSDMLKPYLEDKPKFNDTSFISQYYIKSIVDAIDKLKPISSRSSLSDEKNANVDNISSVISALEYTNQITPKDDKMRTILRELDKIKDDMESEKGVLYQNTNSYKTQDDLKSELKDKAEARKNHKSDWIIQDIIAPNGKTYDDVVQLVYELRKEGFKNIKIGACNPGSVIMPKEIRDDPNFKVTMGMSSVYKEAAEIEEDLKNEELIQEMTNLEAYLDSKSSHSRYSKYLNECTLEELYQEYDKVTRRMALNEGVGQALMNFAHKVVDIIIAIWKKIVGFFKSIFQKVVNFFTGKDDTAEKETPKEFEVTVIEVEGGQRLKSVTKRFKKLSEAQKYIKEQCKNLSDMINKKSKEQVDGIKQVEIKLRQVEVKPAGEEKEKPAEDQQSETPPKKEDNPDQKGTDESTIFSEINFEDFDSYMDNYNNQYASDEEIGYTDIDLDNAKKWSKTNSIAMILPCRSLDDLEQQWDNYNSMIKRHRLVSNDKSVECFGMNNETHYNQLKRYFLNNEDCDDAKYIDQNNIFVPQEHSIFIKDYCSKNLIGKESRCTVYNVLTEALAYDDSNYYSSNIRSFMKKVFEEEEIINRVDTEFLPSSDLPYYTPEEMLDMGVFSHSEVDNFYGVDGNIGEIADGFSPQAWFEAYRYHFIGFDTPNREVMYKQRLRRLHELCTRLAIQQARKGNETTINRYKQAILELGWNPEVPFTPENRIEANNRYKLMTESHVECSFYDVSDANVDELEDVSETTIEITKSKTKIYPVFIVLSGNYRLFSKGIKLMTHSIYSHASLSFDPTLQIMYSYSEKGGGKRDKTNRSDQFRYGGLHQENINLDFSKDSMLGVYTFFLKEKDYNKMKDTVEYLYHNVSKTSYSFINLLSFIFHIKPENNDYKLFCSQFVDKMLKLTGVDITKTKSQYVSPEALSKASIKNGKIYVLYQGTMGNFDGKRNTKLVNSLIKDKSTKVIKEGKQLPENYLETIMAEETTQFMIDEMHFDFIDDLLDKLP